MTQAFIVLYLQRSATITTNTHTMNYFKREFSVFKEGTTAEPVIICSIIGQPFDRSKKIQFYIDLGYTIVKQY